MHLVFTNNRSSGAMPTGKLNHPILLALKYCRKCLEQAILQDLATVGHAHF